jgi:hypothetical protein
VTTRRHFEWPAVYVTGEYNIIIIMGTYIIFYSLITLAHDPQSERSADISMAAVISICPIYAYNLYYTYIGNHNL